MLFRNIVFAVGLVSLIVARTAAEAEGFVDSDEQLAALAEVLLQSGMKGTLTATAAEKFGLEYRDYPERFLEIAQPDGSRRSLELTGQPYSSLFFTQQTAAELITIRSTINGDFIMGFERTNQSRAELELSGNQGRAFLEAQSSYWLHRLAQKENRSQE